MSSTANTLFQVAPDEREAFESWARRYGTWEVQRDDDPALGTTSYTDVTLTVAWHAIQARAALAATPAEKSIELEAMEDMLSSARMELAMVREALGVSIEPHQSLFERMLEAAEAKATAPVARPEPAMPTPCRSMFATQREYADAMEQHRKNWAEVEAERALLAAAPFGLQRLRVNPSIEEEAIFVYGTEKALANVVALSLALETAKKQIEAHTAPAPANALATGGQAQAQAVVSIYVTEDGQRECDDWKVPLPVGRNLLYAAPQAQADARDAAFEAVRKKFCKLQRYSFFLDDKGNVRRTADYCGNWVEFEAVHTLFEPGSVDAAIAAAKGE